MKNPFSFLLVILTLLTLSCQSEKDEKFSDKKKEKEEKEQPVYVIPVTKGPISHYIYSSGTIRAAESVDLYPKSSGYVAKILKDQGDYVEQGAPLMKLEEREWQLGVIEARMQVEEFSQKVQQGKLLISSLENQIEQADLNIQELDALVGQMELDLTQAEKEEERSSRSYQKQLIPEGEYETARYNYEKSKLAKNTTLLQKNKAKVAKQDLILSLERSKIDLRALILQREKASQVTLAQADLLLKNATIGAPFSGVITFKGVNLGELVGPSHHAFSLMNLEKLEITLNIPEKELPLLKNKQQVLIQSDNFLDLKTYGEIRSISPIVDSTSGTTEIIVAFHSDHKLLRPGIFVQSSIQVEHRPSVVLIPRSCLLYEKNRRFVFIIVDNKAEKRFIETGISEIDQIEILSGIEENDLLVTGGHHLLEDEQDVKIIENEDDEDDENEDEDNKEKSEEEMNTSR